MMDRSDNMHLIAVGLELFLMAGLGFFGSKKNEKEILMLQHTMIV